MKQVTNLEDYVKYNDLDTRKIIYKLFPNIVHYYDIDDVTQDIYCHFAKRGVVEMWDPNNAAKFSTWIFVCIKNYIGAYYRRATLNEIGRRNTFSFDTALPDKDGQLTLSSMIEVLNVDTHDLEVTETRINLKQIKELLDKYDLHSNMRKLKISDLFEHYARGSTDSEIAELYNMTVAGVGTTKRTLRSLMGRCESGSIKELIDINIKNYEKEVDRKERSRKWRVRKLANEALRDSAIAERGINLQENTL